MFPVDNSASTPGETGAKDYGIRLCTECLLPVIVQSHFARAIFHEIEFRGRCRLGTPENNVHGVLSCSEKGATGRRIHSPLDIFGIQDIFSAKKN